MHKISLYIRSALFNVIMFITVFTYAIPCLFTFAMPFKVRYKVITQWPRFMVWLAKVLCKINYEVKGLENLPDKNAIILCKHQSAWETWAVQVIFPTQIWVLKKELTQIPLVGWVIALLNPIKLNRKNGKKAMEQLIIEGTQRLADGHWIVMFPEGTRTPVGADTKYKRGAFNLAQASEYPIVPVAHNAGVYWPRRSFIKTPGTIKVVVGKPIDTINKTADELLTQTKTWIESTVREL